MSKLKIYLAGSVPKRDNENFIDWREECKKVLGNEKYEYISPLDNRVSETDSLGVIGQCCSNIKESDLILIYAENKIGAGTSQEILIAKYYSKAVIVYLPKNTPMRLQNILITGKEISDWIHPFLSETTDVIIESYDELENAIDNLDLKEIKKLDFIDKATKHYEKKYL